MPESMGKRYYSSSLGRVMTSSIEDMKVSLFNPFKMHSQIQLPDIDRIKWDDGNGQYFIMKKFVSTSSPSWTSDYIIMVLGKHRTLVFCRPGDNQWTSINTSKRRMYWDDITYYKGKFYVVGGYGTIFVCDIEDPQQPKLKSYSYSFRDA